MPRKRTQIQNKRATPITPVGRLSVAGDAEWGGYINVTVSEAERARFYEWYAVENGSVLRWSEELLAEGLKMSVAYVYTDSCFLVSLTGDLLVGSGLRWCVTSRAPALVEALCLAAWKHFVLCGGEYGDIYAVSGRKADWG
jgi:hypothetical protein